MDRKFKCEECGHEQCFEGRNQYEDCPACGKRVGMKFINEKYNHESLLRFDHKGGVNTYMQVRHRPRGI